MVDKTNETKKQETKPQQDNYTRFTYTKDETDTLKDRYGVLEPIISKTDPEARYKTKWTNLIDLNDSLVGTTVKCRVRLQRSRCKAKAGFLVLRDVMDTAQAVLFVEEGVISTQMVKFVSTIPHESLVDIEAKVVKAEKPVESCTVKNFELAIQTIFVVVGCMNILPFQMEDANRKGNINDEEEAEEPVKEEEDVKEAATDDKKKKKEKKPKKEKKQEQGKVDIIVKSNTRFDNRVLDLRVASTSALMRLQSAVGQLFREFLYKNSFVEIHTPKLIPGASEGGTSVFKLNYFNSPACLAQSPQLYKQMALIGGMDRVFEIAPVFRAENANTTRHLCEFTMIDVELVFKEHYFEVIDVINDLFVYCFDGLKDRFKHELNIVANQYPFELIQYPKELVKIHFTEGVELLKKEGIEQDLYEDLDTVNERRLGEIVRQKYGTDFYLLYGYPKNARPFYTERDPKDGNFTNSYDAFIRGEEVLSGAQRISDYEILHKNVVDAGINPETLKDYLNAFKLGAPPHGGVGIGLERIVKLFTGLGNVKRCCMFPRDPKRLSP